MVDQLKQIQLNLIVYTKNFKVVIDIKFSCEFEMRQGRGVVKETGKLKPQYGLPLR